MKKVLNFLLACVGVVVLSCVSSLGYNYYTESDKTSTEDTLQQVVQFEQAFAQIADPTFTSADDVFQFYERQTEQKLTDSIFLAIPPDALRNIAQVIIGNKGNATKKDIVDEFRQRYRSVYQYIKPVETPVQAQQSDTIHIRSADTIINGEHFKLIKGGSGDE